MYLICRSVPLSRVLGLAVLVALAGATLAPQPAEAKREGASVKYEITFIGLFDADALASGTSVPSDAGFSGVVGGIHDSSESFWGDGVAASGGLEHIAETGGYRAFRNEIEDAVADGGVWRAFRSTWGSLTGTGEDIIRFETTEDFPLLTMVVRIAPSPDWFVGLSGFNLRPDGQWVSGVTIDLYPWDAGTEDGSGFENINADTTPQGAISSLRNSGVFSDGPIAQVKINLKEPPRATDVLVTPGDGRLDVSWTAAIGASGYKVQWESAEEGFDGAERDGRQAIVTGNQNTSYTIPDLENGTEYTVRVIATNAGGDGLQSRRVTGTPVATVTNGSSTDARPVLSIASASVVEGSSLEFTVTLSVASSEVVTVEYSTSDGTATADANAADGADYSAAAAQSLTFAVGETTTTIRIATGDDTADEEDETLTVALSNPYAAQLGSDASATGTIINNDETPATDATLSSFSLTDGNGTTIALSPLVHRYRFRYTASVANDVDSLTASVATSSSGATVSIIGDDDSDSPGEASFDLAVGSNLIRVMVTSSDGSREKNYVAVVTRVASSDATLSSLSLADGDGAAMDLTPSFDAATTDYTATVAYSTASIVVDAAKNHDGATATIIEADGTTTPDTATVALSVGENLIKVMVTSEDAGDSAVYRITVTRAPAWSATLTVGTHTTFVPALTGYHVWGTPVGELTSQSFRLDDAKSYRVLSIMRFGGALYLNIGRALPGNFTLTVGDQEFAAADSSEHTSVAKGRYWWPADGLTWADGDTVTVTITPTDGSDALTGRSKAPPIAYYSNLPANHNGTDAFTLQLHFTEDVDLDAATLRDDTLQITNGTATNATRATAGSNLTWNITIQPDSTADVTINLPATQDCADTAAICTNDGRKLSNTTTITITGPPSDDATLATLALDGVDLAPVFAADTFAYTAAVDHDVWILTVRATVADADATAVISPGDVDAITGGHQITLGEGANDVSVDVTAADGTALTYTVTVTRDANLCFTPTPTDVAVDAVPIVVNSTIDDYFVLYVTHDVDGKVQELPVLVKLGEPGTTTLAESAPALPVERYRVEKYQVTDPADVDGDCLDDLTELEALGEMNPVNPAATLDPEDGVVAVVTAQSYLSFVMTGLDLPLRPSIYFQNSANYPGHDEFMREVLGAAPFTAGTLRGQVIYAPNAVSPDGSPGAYVFFISGYVDDCSYLDRAYSMLVASMPVLTNNLAYWVAVSDIQQYRRCSSLLGGSRITLSNPWGSVGYVALNEAAGFGLLRKRDADERPHSREVVIYEALPNELPRVAGIVSTVPQTPLSHVNLRAIQNGIPNAYIRDGLSVPDITDLIGSYVRYEVLDTDYSIREATKAEVDAFYGALRPAETQTPQRDFSVTSITALSDIGFDDWDSFGVKAANLAVLGTLDFPEGTVPDGFAIPFYFYDEFMKANGFYDEIEEMLADEDFQTDFDKQEDELKKLRKAIKNGETPQWIIDALTEMHAAFPEGTSLRYRSSTNNEDLPRFNGAGLYDSKTQHPDETEEDGIDKSLKQVYAGLWTFRAFTEREFHRIDHAAASMGVLVHPNFSDELANGVAVTFDPTSGRYDRYYANTQVGEDLVTNPEAHSVPEELLLGEPGYSATGNDPTLFLQTSGINVISLSNLVEPGEILIMSDEQIGQLRQHLGTIHDHFKALYNPARGEDFAMEIEYKITSEDVLSIKQARPWVFAEEPPLAAHFVAIPDGHDGSTPFELRLDFTRNVQDGQAALQRALVVTGGAVTAVRSESTSSSSGGSRWEITVRPDGDSSVTVTLAGGIACGQPGAICTADGVHLTNSPEVSVAGPPSDDTALETLTVEGADLVPMFTADTLVYTAEVDHDVTVVTVSATAAEAGSSTEIAPGDSDAGTPGHQVLLAEGDNAVTVTVTASDGATMAYSVTITRELAVEDATITSLSLTGVTLTPSFARDTDTYEADVAADVAQVTIEFVTTQASATGAVVPGDSDASTPGHQIALTPGLNTITVNVTAADTITTRSYTINVKRAFSAQDALLEALSIDGFELSPAFASSTYAYTASVDYDTSPVTLDLAKGYRQASVEVAPGDEDPNTPGWQISLAEISPSLQPSVTDISVTVTSADTSTTRVYTVAATRQVPANRSAKFNFALPEGCVLQTLKPAGWKLIRAGHWKPDCRSLLIYKEDSSLPEVTGYAHFYHFTVQQQSNVVIGMDHSDSSYRLVLRDSDGSIIEQIMYHETLFDCRESYELDCDRWFSRVLKPGDYVIEAIQQFSNDGRETAFTVSVHGAVRGAVIPGVAMLSAVTVDGAPVLPFLSADGSYEIPRTASQVTVAVDTAAMTAPEVLILPADADPNTAGHQVEVARFGLTPVAVIVTDAARSATEVHRLVFSGDHPDDSTTTATVDVDGSVVGRIDSNGDRDWFAVQLDSAGTYQIDLRGADTGDGTLADPYLRGAYDSASALIAGSNDNDSGDGLNSNSTITVSTAGTYYIEVNAAGTGVGTYTLSVSRA